MMEGQEKVRNSTVREWGGGRGGRRQVIVLWSRCPWWDAAHQLAPVVKPPFSCVFPIIFSENLGKIYENFHRQIIAFTAAMSQSINNWMIVELMHWLIDVMKVWQNVCRSDSLGFGLTARLDNLLTVGYFIIDIIKIFVYDSCILLLFFYSSCCCCR